MFIPGYAGTSDQLKTILEYARRHEEIAHSAPFSHVTKRPDYICTYFKGRLTMFETQALSESDLALIADRGNLIFGASCTKEKDGNGFLAVTTPIDSRTDLAPAD